MKSFGEKNLDVLQNIEFGIVQVYRANPALLDLDAADAIDALARYYHAQEEGRTPTTTNLSERAADVFRSVQLMCEWRLGRAPLPGETSINESSLPLVELVRCLREIQKSIPRWTRQGGRQGYLKFVVEYFP